MGKGDQDLEKTTQINSTGDWGFQSEPGHPSESSVDPWESSLMPWTPVYVPDVHCSWLKHLLNDSAKSNKIKKKHMCVHLTLQSQQFDQVPCPSSGGSIWQRSNLKCLFPVWKITKPILVIWGRSVKGGLVLLQTNKQWLLLVKWSSWMQLFFYLTWTSFLYPKTWKLFLAGKKNVFALLQIGFNVNWVCLLAPPPINNYSTCMSSSCFVAYPSGQHMPSGSNAWLLWLAHDKFDRQNIHPITPPEFSNTDYRRFLRWMWNTCCMMNIWNSLLGLSGYFGLMDLMEFLPQFLPLGRHLHFPENSSTCPFLGSNPPVENHCSRVYLTFLTIKRFYLCE